MVKVLLVAVDTGKENTGLPLEKQRNKIICKKAISTGLEITDK